MDNFLLDVTSYEMGDLRRAVELAMERVSPDGSLQSTTGVIGFSVSFEEDASVISFHYFDYNHSCNKFPCNLSVETLVVMIRDWLALVEYPERPRIDGSAKKGWRLVVDCGDHGVLFKVKTVWALIGK